MIPISRQLAKIFPFLALLSLQASAVGQSSITSGGIYNIVSVTSGMALDNGGSFAPGTAVSQGVLTAGDTDQQWVLTQLADGRYQMVCLSSGMALDTGGATTNNALVVQNAPSATANGQQWQVTVGYSGAYQIASADGMALDNTGSTSAGSAVWQASIVNSDSNQQWQLVPVQIGASTPFTTYEAESGVLGGGATISALTSPPTTEFSSPPLEASGHAYVQLSQVGQSVTITNTTGKPMTAINVRYSIPNASAGGGIVSTLDLLVNGSFRQALPVNSKQTWVYETASNYDGMSHDPSSGNPHVFWDEVHAFITGAPVAPGGTVTLQFDATNNAPYYDVDLVELEAPPAPLAQPSNSISITSCGAVANDPSFDSTAAIQQCINQAEAQGETVWIPQGIFYLTAETPLTTNGATIQGAGMWYSTLYSNPTLPATGSSYILIPVGGALENFEIDGNAISDQSVDGNRGPVNIKGSNWLINSLWIHHEGPGIWADGTNGLVENCRLNNTWADGINVNNGNGQAGNNIGNNLTVRNNFVRGSGDDGFAINESLAYPANVMMSNITVINNTSVAPWWANNFGVFGGVNDLVANNLGMDSVKGLGINFGYFGSNDSTLDTAFVQGNTILRGGSFGYGSQRPAVGVGYTSPAPADTVGMVLRGNTIGDAMFDGIGIYVGQGMEIINNTVLAPGDNGITVEPDAAGNALLVCNTVQNPRQLAFVDDTPSLPIGGSCNTDFNLAPSLTTPIIAVTAAPSTLLTSQATAVNVSVSGSTSLPSPTGTVLLTSGSFVSAAVTLANGTASMTIPAGTFGVGTNIVTASYTPDAPGSAYFSSAFATLPVSVTNPAAPDFSLSYTGAGVVITPGATSGNTATVSVTPSGGFTGTVELSCYVTPTLRTPMESPTCSVPASINITGASAVTAAVTITTTAPSVAFRPAGVAGSGAGPGLTAAAGCLALMASWKRRTLFRGLLVVLLTLTSVITLTGCGNISSSNGTSSAGTSPGSYSVTVTGNSGNLAQSTIVSVSVN